jgi:hypothetical protein
MNHKAKAFSSPLHSHHALLISEGEEEARRMCIAIRPSETSEMSACALPRSSLLLPSFLHAFCAKKAFKKSDSRNTRASMRQHKKGFLGSFEYEKLQSSERRKRQRRKTKKNPDTFFSLSRSPFIKKLQFFTSSSSASLVAPKRKGKKKNQE